MFRKVSLFNKGSDQDLPERQSSIGATGGLPVQHKIQQNVANNVLAKEKDAFKTLKIPRLAKPGLPPLRDPPTHILLVYQVLRGEQKLVRTITWLFEYIDIKPCHLETEFLILTILQNYPKTFLNNLVSYITTVI